MTTNIKDYSTTQASNTSLNTIDVDEGMLPSNLNNAIRALMKNTRDWFNDAQWIEYGDGSGAYTAAYASSSSFTINGADVTSVYHAGRRIKLTAATPGTIFGTISSSSFSTNTTVNVTWDSGSLSSETISNVYISALSKTNSSIPTEIIGTTNIVDSAVTSAKLASNAITTAKITDGNVTQAKLASDSVNGTKIADDSINSEHYVDGSIDTAHIADAQITTAKITDGNVTLAKMAADSVNGSKIADDSINSEHYVDGSIDTAHIADSQVTTAKIADSQITSAKITDGAIVNADINASAAIDATKIADGTVTSAEFQYINTLSSNAQTQIDAKAATTYVDNAVAGLRTRIIAECATTANVNLSNGLEAGDSIDGVTLVSGDRVLVKDQSTASENGLYLAVGSGAGAASRDPEHDTIAELSGGMVVVNQGTANDNKIFLCTTDTDATLDTTSITYTTITPQNVGTVTSITAGTGLSGGAITSSGTIAIDSTVATLTGTQTLTNKTLTTPVIAEIDSASSGNITLDSEADIILDADNNGTVAIKDAGTQIGSFFKTASTFSIKSDVSDKRLEIKGNDGGSQVIALTFHMANNGQAVFSDKVTSGAGLVIADGANIGSASDADSIAISSSGVVTFSGSANVGQQALTSSSNAVAWDASAKPNAVHVTTENTTFSAPTNNVEGAFIALEINYNGSHTIAFNTIFEFAASTAPTFTSTDGKTDILVFRYNGAVWQEVGRTLNLSES